MKPVEYTPDNQAIVDAFNDLPAGEQLGQFWSNDVVKPIRSQIKQHHVECQEYRCAYCAKQIVTNNETQWDVEHVIPRSLAVRFMFVPENLAVSCKDCNIAKKEKEVRVNPKRKSFPDQSAHYRIAHPHFDEYSEHIRWFGYVCAPLSRKGMNTISLCDLGRFTAEKLGIHSLINDAGFDDLVGKLLDAKSPLELQATVAGLKVYAESIPQE